MRKIIFSICIILLSITLSGCFKKDTMENINIYTTSYPIEYITSTLYGDNATIYSIYPDNVNINDYNLTDKQITDYSSNSLFIYNGLSKEKDYAIKMLNKNKGLKIIDAAMAMEYVNGMDELWLDPSNFLMLAQNIRNGFKEYITNPYLKKEIDSKYEDLKIKVSEIDADLKLVAENASNKTIVVSNDLFLFFEKYGFNVISLDEDSDHPTDKELADIKTLMGNGTIKYIFMKQNEKINGTIQYLINTYKVTALTIQSGNNLTEQQRTDKIDFIKIMNSNIDSLKLELYQ